jgi:hypothetical protein
MKTITAGVLEVAYHEIGPADGPPAILLHGFPYDTHSYDDVSRRLSDKGVRCLMPYLRGYGATRFRSSDTPRSGQQAALGVDLHAFMDALSIPQAVSWRIRLGRPGRMHRRGVMARPRQGFGELRPRLQHPGHFQCREACATCRGSALLVYVLLQHGAREGRPDREPNGALPVHLESLVTDLELRCRDVRRDRRLL